MANVKIEEIEQNDTVENPSLIYFCKKDEAPYPALSILEPSSSSPQECIYYKKTNQKLLQIKRKLTRRDKIVYVHYKVSDVDPNEVLDLEPRYDLFENHLSQEKYRGSKITLIVKNSERKELLLSEIFYVPVDLRAYFRVKLNLPKAPNAVPEFHMQGKMVMSLKCDNERHESSRKDSLFSLVCIFLIFYLFLGVKENRDKIFNKMVTPFIRMTTSCIANSIYVSDSIMEDPIRDTVNDTSLKNSMVQDLDGSIVNNASLKNSLVQDLDGKILNNTNMKNSVVQEQNGSIVKDASLKNSMVQDLEGSMVNNPSLKDSIVHDQNGNIVNDASLKDSIVHDQNGDIVNDASLKDSIVHDQNGNIVNDASLKDSIVHDQNGNIVNDASLKDSIVHDQNGDIVNDASLKDSMAQDLIDSIANSANNLMVDDLQLNETIDKMPQTDKSRENDENLEHLIKDLLGGCGDEWEWMETAIAYVLSDIYGLSTMRKLASLDLQSAVTTSNLWFTLYLADINRDEALNKAVEVFLLDRIREARSKKASKIENPFKTADPFQIQKVCPWKVLK
ncbi:hypothetical protein CDAR_400721 [Caerostris darwini]|uniref:Uncharacterized protein n=1 Tax=Caerostris darwini TaxID=1538125 RepID=A0AAV4NAR1_9ARAC|nr:hypothetical protein CDAR_400721 [Caerostris darwini]